MPAAPTLAGTIVGACYRILRPLGEGGMGTVYEAQHLRLGGRVAVKILSPQLAADPKFRDRFKREARAVAQIHHPNVVQITDFGETPGGSVFFAMELLEGRDLQAILREHAPLPWRRAQHLLVQAADALAAAHRCGVIHRDVKPANCFVLESEGVRDFVKLLDFGIAKIHAASTTDSTLLKNLTGTGEIFGTAKYMAPEQAYGSSNDPRADVYSLGVVAYEMLTGRVPFDGGTSFEILTRHINDQPRPPRELQPNIPEALETIVLRAMEKQPEQRFNTMDELARALRAASEHDAPWPGVARRPTLPQVAARAAHTDAATVPQAPKGERVSISPTAVLPPSNAADPSLPKPVPVAPATNLADSPALATPTQRTTKPPREEAATGPQGQRAGSSFDETGRDATLGSSSASFGSKRPVMLLLLALGVAALSATGVFLAVGPGVEVPQLAAELAPLKGPQPVASPTPLEEAKAEIEVAVEPKTTARIEAPAEPKVTAEIEVAEEPEAIVDDEAVPVVGDPEPVEVAAKPEPKSDARSTNAGGAASKQGPSAVERARELVRAGDKAYAAGRLDAAERHYEDALAAYSNAHAAAAGLGRIAFNNASYADAAKFFGRAVKSSTANGEYRILYGDALFKLDRFADAKLQYNKAKELGSARADGRLEKVAARLGG